MSCPCQTRAPEFATLPAVVALPTRQPSPPLVPCQLRTAAELCRVCRIELEPRAAGLLRDELSPRELFEVLLQHDCLADARRVLAHALPKRRALWWGCLCAADVYRPQPPEIVAEVLAAVTRFIRRPSEAHRRATSSLGWKAGPTTIAGCLALGTFCSGGSISLPGLPEVAPKPFITGRLVGVAVYLASVARDPARYKDRLRQYLALGVEVAGGKNLWAEPSTVEANTVEAFRLDEGDVGHAEQGVHVAARVCGPERSGRSDRHAAGATGES